MPDIHFSLCLGGIGVVPDGAVITVNLAVSTTSDGTFDVDCRWVKGDGEVLFLDDGNGLGGDFDDLECCRVETGGEHTGDQERKRGKRNSASAMESQGDAQKRDQGCGW